MAKGKIKAKLKKAAQKVKAAAKKVVGKGKDAALAPVLPFKGLMRRELDRRGIKYNPNSLHEIAALFVHHIVKGQRGHFNYNLMEGGGNHTMYIEGDTPHNIVADVALTLVTTIINYLKNLKAKKDAGQPLTQDEERVLDAAGKVADQVVAVSGDVAQDTIAGMVKDFIFSWKGGLTLILLVALLIAAFYNPKRAS